MILKAVFHLKMEMKKKTILISEDDKITHKLYTRFLSKEYDILHAYDGAEALMVATEKLPDLILLDIIMPLMDGRTVCQKLKNYPRTSAIKIVMLTGKDEQHDRILGLELGADEFVTKPCTPDYIKRIVRKILRA